jgi:hypothetical protein
MRITKRQLRKIIREAMQLEMFDTGSAGDEVGGTDLEQKKELCKQAGGQWVSDDPSGKYGHCSKPIDESDEALEEDKSGKGKCPDSGCISKRGDKWRIISNKTGKLWPQHYDTKEKAEAALDAYHVHN